MYLFWMNIDRPTNSCTLHDCHCPFVIQTPTKYKGIEEDREHGLWRGFLSIVEAEREYSSLYSNMKYKHCNSCLIVKTRTELATKRKSELRKKLLGIPIMLVILIISIVFYMFSLVLWGKKLQGTVHSELMVTIFTINLISVGTFMGIGFGNVKFLVTLTKSLLKILFTVWVVFIVQLSTLEQIEQNVWIILSAFFFVNFEVLADINDSVYQIKDDFQSSKIKFINANFIKENSISLSILCLSTLNIILSFFIVNLLDALRLG